MSASDPAAAKVTADSRGTPTFRSLLESTQKFVVVAELVTSRGLISDRPGRRILDHARALAQNARIDALSITDNPAGNAMLAPDTLGTDLISRGQEVIIHLACKDWNRNALQSRGWKLSSEGFDNILALSGDYPSPGYGGLARPSFDIDSVGLLSMYSDMNRGLLDSVTGRRMAPTNFFLGAVVSNHKRHEREVVPQYLKLQKKIAAGARFVINQVGYHSRKDDELLRWLALRGLNVPVIANVFLLSPGAARAFNAGRIPGIVVTDELLALAERHARSADHGRSFFIDLAARQVAIARGLGFRGVYVGGKLEVSEYDDVLSLADEFRPDDWKALAREIQFAHPDEFHYFERDETTGLSSSEVDKALLASRSSAARRRSRVHVPIAYRASRMAHSTIFEPGSPLFDFGRKFYATVERGPRQVQRVLHAIEHAAKVPLFDCQDCGDCSLPEIAYLCPESQCVKNQRNGPCGGTRDGLCEIGEKECIWAQAYERLKAYGEEDSMLDGPVVFNDNSLRGTSAWANTFLGRDHQVRPEAAQEGESLEHN
jgi:methylenetetrahydrofolate reductase (NADPH)